MTRKRTKRWMFRILLCLLLGVVTTVGVAWGFACWTPQESWIDERNVTVPSTWPDYLEDLHWPTPQSAIERVPWGGVGVTVIEFTGGDPDASWEASAPADKVFVSLEARQFGIPARSLQWEIHGVRAGSRSLAIARAADDAAGWRAGVEVSEVLGAMREGNTRRLPVTPILPGFIINTFFYAAIWFGVFFGIARVKRFIRIKRGRRALTPGRSPGGRGEEDGCPECGWGRGE